MKTKDHFAAWRPLRRRRKARRGDRRRPRRLAHVHPGQGSEPTRSRKSSMTIASTGSLAVRISSGVCHADQNTMASMPTASCAIRSWRATLYG